MAKKITRLTLRMDDLTGTAIREATGLDSFRIQPYIRKAYIVESNLTSVFNHVLDFIKDEVECS